MMTFMLRYHLTQDLEPFGLTLVSRRKFMEAVGKLQQTAPRLASSQSFRAQPQPTQARMANISHNMMYCSKQG